MNNPIAFPNLGLELDPSQGFSIGPLDIRFYGLVIALGLLLAVFYAMRRCKQFGLKQDDLLDGVLWIAPFAILCARLYYCAFSWESYADNPISILYIWEGGIAIYGSVIGAVIGILVFCKIKKVSVGAVLDLVLLGFLIGQLFGRWGNFFNREAFGSYSDGLLAMQIPVGNLPGINQLMPEIKSFVAALQQGIPYETTLSTDVAELIRASVEGGYVNYIRVHPTFLYESLWNLAGFIGLHFLSKKRRYDGQIALGYAAWYGLGRLWIEGLRMDSLYWGPFRVSQLLAGVTCVAAITLLVVLHFRRHKPLFVHRIAPAEPEEEAPSQEPAEEPAEEPAVTEEEPDNGNA